MEIFRYIEGTNYNYSVSNYGRVKSNSRIITRSNNRTHAIKERILKYALDEFGYKRVAFNVDGKFRTHKVHRLVAITFFGIDKNNTQVNHIDGDKTNNNILNLEWVNNSENQLHSYKILNKKPMSGDRNGMAKLTWDDIYNIRTIACEKGRYYGRKELSIKYKVSEDTIKSIVQNKTWKI